MNFGIFDNFGALNSRPVWAAFKAGVTALGLSYQCNDWNADVAVIWSMVWSGRMRDNRRVWQHFRDSGRPVIVLEVGMLQRGRTWKIAINGTGSDAYHGQGIDHDRANQLGISLRPWHQPGDDILICLQRSDSHQWHRQPPLAQWLLELRTCLRAVTQRRLVLRPHPRQPAPSIAGFDIEQPRHLSGTYDDFDLDHGLRRAWAVINHNSAPGVLAAIQGVPVFVDHTSLAAPVGNLDLGAMESPVMPEREAWLSELCHTEWTIPEIASGWPLQRLLPGLQSR